jgi:hypothetical protein
MSYSFISLSNLYFFILFTNPLPPKRSANVEEKSFAAKQYVEISCYPQLIRWETSAIIFTILHMGLCKLYNKGCRAALVSTLLLKRNAFTQ